MLIALATFLAALLLFGVQPLVGKWLLPRHGGVPAVWGMALVFFQVALLAGYALAHGLTRRLSPRAAGLAHAALLAASVLVLAIQQWTWGAPLLVPAGELGGTGWPGWTVLAELACAAGIPIVAVAASAPIFLASRAAARPASSPYGLVALGNAGSLVALMAYPLWVEPSWTLALQAQGWWAAVGLLALVSAIQALCLPAARPAREESERIPLWRWVRWGALAGAPVAFLSAMTTALTHELAPVPLLWVLPLAVYLLAWIAAFRPGGRPWAVAAIAVGFVALVPISTDLLSKHGAAWGLVWLSTRLSQALSVAIGEPVGGRSATVALGIGLGLLSLYGAALACHGELARDRPGGSGATAFTLAIAAGGALGGIAAAVVAPFVLDDLFELPLAFLACALGALVWRDVPWRRRGVRIAVVATMGVVLLGPAFRSRPDQVAIRRTFFGIIRVRHIGAGTEHAAHELLHGGVVHGLQFITEPYRRAPTGYYHVDSGLGRAIDSHRRHVSGGILRVGLVGLGAGTIAAYGRPGDVFRFYEIDPEMAVLARRYFSYLDDSAAAIEVAIGDGRIVLERELATGHAGRFDLLVLDAFGGGTVPVHLLTREAALVYRAHLAPGGALAVHVSGAHVDLVPVAHGMASAIGFHAVTAFHPGDPPATTASVWVIASQDERWLASRAFADGARPRPPALRVWTDQASNLFEVLRR